MRAQRHDDVAITDPKTLVVSFDLENVVALSRTTVSSAFYKCKLNVYNLTAVVNRTKEPFCAVWTETTAGRSGNDLASAIIHLLEAITSRHSDTNSLILWSDSCVPQNRNQILSYALQLFIDTNKSIQKIIHRYCEPGHSSIQDVDTLHSNIEGAIKRLEIFSPLTLIRLLTKLNPAGKEMYVRILKSADFKDYKSLAHCGQYEKVGYASVSELTYTGSDVRTLKVRRCMSKSEAQSFTVLKMVYLRGKKLKPLAQPKQLPEHSELKKKKADDLRSLLKYMDGANRIYMENSVKNAT